MEVHERTDVVEGARRAKLGCGDIDADWCDRTVGRCVTSGRVSEVLQTAWGISGLCIGSLGLAVAGGLDDDPSHSGV